ncbi:TPA: hemolytic protein HlpA-like protein [Candidatus Sumerlaeota bacterium]|jgi:hypothetical protein|nr:hemolytic protein HlpA-like protein [Candidatus Sumerlaeota bacterium]
MSPVCPPVALIIFNRPETTAQVFERIRQAQPKQLFIIADAPRPDRAGEAERCAQARAITEQVDWDCTVLRNYAEANMGCKWRPISGISWVFEQVEQAIILEDDCLPDLSFFPYCGELLERYRDNAQVMVINGNSYLPDHCTVQDSYAFTHLLRSWGWATWRRAWALYDVEMKQWPAVRDSGELEKLFSPTVWHTSKIELERAYDGTYAQAWDYQWHFTILQNHGLCVRPAQNLVANLGVGGGGTHTTVDHPLGTYPSHAMEFPLRHPDMVVADVPLDREELLFLDRLSPRKGWQRFLPKTGIVGKLKQMFAR